MKIHFLVLFFFPFWAPFLAPLTIFFKPGTAPPLCFFLDFQLFRFLFFPITSYWAYLFSVVSKSKDHACFYVSHRPLLFSTDKLHLQPWNYRVLCSSLSFRARSFQTWRSWSNVNISRNISSYLLIRHANILRKAFFIIRREHIHIFLFVFLLPDNNSSVRSGADFVIAVVWLFFPLFWTVP